MGRSTSRPNRISVTPDREWTSIKETVQWFYASKTVVESQLVELHHPPAHLIQIMEQIGVNVNERIAHIIRIGQ